MRSSRKAIAEFIGVFVIGALVGALIMWDLRDTQLTEFMTKTNDPDSVMVDRINQKYIKDYNLTPDELNRIQPLVKSMAHDIARIRHQFGNDFYTAFSDYHRKIADQLDPDHRAAYLKATEERKAQLSNMLFDQSPPAAQGQH